MAAPLLPALLRDGDRLTRDEFMRRWEQMPDLMRAELIDAVVHLPSPLTNVHGTSQVELTYWLGCYIAATPGCSAAAAATWLMSKDSTPQPDLALVILPEFGGQSRLEGEYAAGAPELIVEISHTTSAKDSGAKLRLYESNGVREYLTVRPGRQHLDWRELVEGGYRDIAPEAGGFLHSRVFPGLWLDPSALWAGDFAGLAAAVQQGIATPGHAEFVRGLAEQKR